jgi:hypothetical protein
MLTNLTCQGEVTTPSLSQFLWEGIAFSGGTTRTGGDKLSYVHHAHECSERFIHQIKK